MHPTPDRTTSRLRLRPLGLLLALPLAPFAALPAVAQDLGVKSPPAPFGELPHPPAPDYSKPEHWAALPGRLDAADVVPENDPFGDRQATAPVDVFYIHPTTFNQAAWNQPLDDAKTNDWTDESVIARQAAVFNACCRVYAPRYRQAASAAVYAPPQMKALGAYEFAWGDVRAAFRHYLEHWNAGRPFILAGHSQGAAHIERWLNEFGADPALARRLVAAYPIGIGFTQGRLARLPGGRGLCRTPADTGCIVSWNAFAPDAQPQGFVAATQKRHADPNGTDAGRQVACLNPLTFDLAKPAAPAAWNLGALPARRGVGLAAGLAAATPLAATEAGRIGARCEDGALVVDALPAQGYALVPLPGGSLHFNDFDLFYQNIRVNAVVRSEAFLAAGRRRR
ncbi:MAG: DUF3089 domain-containing protein [Steroidobacteraceae bacterium]|jgi:hypothetical protein|nr:DUF3089 domain-containing protein [Steroidobacteraceae bacterium]